MVSKEAIVRMAMEQMALDNACNASDFLKTENTIVEYKKIDGRRVFSNEDYFFKMVTFGSGGVVSANSKIHEWCGVFFSKRKGIDCFEHPVMREIDKELIKYNKMLNVVHELYLPYYDFERKDNKITDVKWFEKDEIQKLYKDSRFKNALLYDEDSPRPDVLVVASYEGDEITGMAGASMDSEKLWQIGIDVMPEYRNKGIAKYLVNLLTVEIFNRGAIPYYGTWCSNIASRNIAQRCGFFPAWTEMYSVECEE